MAMRPAIRRGLVPIIASVAILIPHSDGRATTGVFTNVVAQRSDTAVITVGAPQHPGVATLAREWSIGVVNGPAEYLFSRISQLTVLRDGSLIIVDGTGTTQAVRQYDAAGRYLRTIGRVGDGPGEYQMVTGVAELPDGRIVMADRARRLNVYSATGRPLVTWRPNIPFALTNNPYAGLGSSLFTDTLGTLYLATSSGTSVERAGPLTPSFVRLRSDGTVIDTIPPAVFGYRAPWITGTGISTESGKRVVMIGTFVPFAPIPMSAWSPLGYLVTAIPNRYAVELRIPPRSRDTSPLGSQRWRPGDGVVSLRRPNVVPTPVTTKERASARSAVETYMRKGEPTWRWSGPDVPSVKPAFTAIRVSQDGQLWLRVPLAIGAAPDAESHPQPAVFDVIVPDGRYIGSVAIPAEMTPYVMRGDLVWGVTSDTDGVQSIHRCRVSWK
jgi:hypothetical protein